MAAAVKPLPLEAAAAAAIELRDELRERTGYPWVDAQPCYTAEKYAERCINGFARDAREMEVGGRTLTVGGIVGPASKGSIIRDPDGLMAGAGIATDGPRCKLPPSVCSLHGVGPTTLLRSPRRVGDPDRAVGGPNRAWDDRRPKALPGEMVLCALGLLCAAQLTAAAP